MKAPRMQGEQGLGAVLGPELLQLPQALLLQEGLWAGGGCR